MTVHKKLYFTRHGQTVWNVENKICGATDIGLTELGRQQADALGEIIKNGELLRTKIDNSFFESEFYKSHKKEINI